VPPQDFQPSFTIMLCNSPHQCSSHLNSGWAQVSLSSESQVAPRPREEADSGCSTARKSKMTPSTISALPAPICQSPFPSNTSKLSNSHTLAPFPTTFMYLELLEPSRRRSRRTGVRDLSNMAPNPFTRDTQPTPTDIDWKMFAALRRKNPPEYVPFSLLSPNAHTSWIVVFPELNDSESSLNGQNAPRNHPPVLLR
jgi:hypothetical protein